MNDTGSDLNMTNRCSQCGRPLPGGILEGLCPACLLKEGAFETGTQAQTSSFEPPTVAEVAALFPQLEILELLGKGGMGAVYKARQPKLDRLVALKILALKAEEGSEFAERFNREARALAKLNHPNIVSVYEFGQVSGRPFLIMEYVDGTTLRQIEAGARLEPAQALRIVPQICEALQFAHDEGVVHRDIKPENILIDKKGRVKIADFGIAKLVGTARAPLSLTETRQTMGTPNYMAPEQLEKPQLVDHRADIFSLGVVFYEMLTGELPLGKFGLPSQKAAVDARFDNVVLRALEKEPERRYQQADEVKTDVRNIAAEPGRADAKPGEKRRFLSNPALAAVGVVAVVGVLLAITQPWAAGQDKTRASQTNSPSQAIRLPAQTSALTNSSDRRNPEASAGSERFKAYSVNRTVGELAESLDASTPESANAAIDMRMITQDPATVMARYGLSSVKLPTGSITITITPEQRRAVREGKILEVIVYRENLAAVVSSLTTNGVVQFLTPVFGRRGGEWKVLLDNALDPMPTQQEAVQQFKASVGILWETYQTMPDTPADLQSVMTSNLVSGMGELMGGMIDMTGQMAGQAPKAITNIQQTFENFGRQMQQTSSNFQIQINGQKP